MDDFSKIETLFVWKVSTTIYPLTYIYNQPPEYEQE
jgi:hypothetical protein